MAMNVWSGEVLIPQTNVSGYQKIYEAETWLRRICLAAFLLSEGPAWAATVNPTLRSRIEEEVARNSSRWYLGVDSDEEFLWSTTQGQLGELLRRENIAAAIHKLCDVKATVLADQLKTIGQIRNALAHNRAISSESMVILDGAMTVVLAAVSRFKSRTLYAKSEILLSDEEGFEDLSELIEGFEQMSQRFQDQHLFLAANDDFVFFVRLPVAPMGQWPDSIRLSNALGMRTHLTLCVLANKIADEIQIVLPRRIEAIEKFEVLNCFMSNEVLRDCWTDVPPEEQNPARVCWPRLWFYENRNPAH